MGQHRADQRTFALIRQRREQSVLVMLLTLVEEWQSGAGTSRRSGDAIALCEFDDTFTNGRRKLANASRAEPASQPVSRNQYSSKWDQKRSWRVDVLARVQAPRIPTSANPRVPRNMEFSMRCDWRVIESLLDPDPGDRGAGNSTDDQVQRYFS